MDYNEVREIAKGILHGLAGLMFLLMGCIALLLGIVSVSGPPSWIALYAVSVAGFITGGIVLAGIFPKEEENEEDEPLEPIPPFEVLDDK